MTRRASYQKGHVFKRGKKGQQAYVARWRERVLRSDNSLGWVHRSVVLGSVGEIGSKTEARRLLETRLRSMNLGRRCPQSTMSFEQFVGTVWKPSELLIGEHTHRLYDSLLRTHLFPVFGQERLCDIQRVDLALFFGEKRRQGVSPSHINGMRAVLSKVLSAATEWGYLESNPVRGLRIGPRTPVRDREVPTEGQVRILVAALKEPCRTLVALAALTGLRIGELLGLEWKHIDFLREELSVEQALKEGGKIGKVKTESSKARIPLSPDACQFFEQYRMSCRDPKLDSLVFQTGKGTPLNPSNLRNRDLGPMCQKLGLPHFTWHCFRHTAGTLLTDEAESMKTVQSLLRHSDIGQTSRYAHPGRSSQRRAVRKLGSRLQLFPTVPKSEEGSREGKQLTN